MPAPPTTPPTKVDVLAQTAEDSSLPTLVRWSTWTKGMFFDCFAIRTPLGPVLVDPQVPAAESVEWVSDLMGRPPVATVLTASWHERSAYAIRDHYGAPVWLPRAGVPEMEGQPDHLYDESTSLPAGLRPITMDDTYAGDTVLLWTAADTDTDRRGVLFTGDVILAGLDLDDPRSDHWRRRPGLYLWLHGPGDATRFRDRFARLLAEDFDTICSAHSVVQDHPKAQLAHLLERGHTIERPMQRHTAIALTLY